MRRLKVEWDPSWDEDWLSAQRRLEDEIEEQRPRSPREAVEFYRYGFSIARRHPLHEWADVESNLYQDYMSGAPEPGEAETEETNWEDARAWAYRGWEAAQT